MRLRIRPGRWPLLFLIAFSASALPARADIGRFLGFVKPFLAGSLYSAIPIDIGADGRTDLLIDGWGTLDGTDYLNWNSDFGTHLLVRQPDGRWAQRESLEGDHPCVTDLDRDGLEDLIVERHWEVIYYRQSGNGLLLQAGAYSIPAEWRQGTDRLLSIGDGRVLRLAYGFGLTALLLEWRGGEGRFDLAWADTLQDSGDLWFNRCGIANAFGVPYVVGTAPSGLWAAPITPEGPGVPVRSRTFPINDYDVIPLQGADGGRVLLWSRSEGNVYSEVLPGPDSVSLRFDRLKGIPKLCRSGDPAVLSRMDRSRIIAFPRIDSLGHCVAYVRVDGAFPPRYVESARWANSRFIALVSAPDRLELVALTDYGGVIAPSEGRSDRDPDLPFHIAAAVATSDLDGDGAPDPLFVGRSGAEDRGLWIARGIDRYPWFASPERLPVTDDLWGQQVAVADLDGDGKRDILLIGQSSVDITRLHPYFQIEGGFESGEVAELSGVRSIPPEGIGDFDGDGRAEVPYQLDLFGGALRLLRWNRDRAVDPSVCQIENLNARPIIKADLDGDGKDELVVESVPLLSAVRLYPRERASQTFTPVITPASPYSSWSGDMNGDGKDELYVERTTGTLHSFSADGTDHILREDVRRRAEGDASIADIDGDGVVELVAAVQADGSLEIIDDLTTPGTEPAVWIAPDGAGAVSGPAAFWRDVDHDGDPDPIFICRDGIRVGRNDAIGPVASRSQDGMVRLVSASPAGTSARVAVRLTRPGGLDLALYDVTGRALWSGRRASAPPDEWIEFIVAPDPAKGAIARGVYFLKVVGGGRVATRRILFGF